VKLYDNVKELQFYTALDGAWLWPPTLFYLRGYETVGAVTPPSLSVIIGKSWGHIYIIAWYNANNVRWNIYG